MKTTRTILLSAVILLAAVPVGYAGGGYYRGGGGGCYGGGWGGGYRGGYGYGPGWGWPFAAGVVAGAVLAPPVYYAPSPVYYAPPVVIQGPRTLVYEDARYVAPQPSSDMLTKVQLKLSALGYYKGGIDGAYGQQTASAVEKFQSDNGLPVSGRLDLKTLAALDVRL